jgi:transposase
MTILNTMPARVLGFDVAKDTITVFDSLTGSLQTIANRRAAVGALLCGLDRHCFGVCEPTGGYEVLLLEQLVAAGIACHRADTVKVKAFIRSFGTLAKTDALDARALARYGQERWQRLALFSPADGDQQVLTALVTRRQELGTLKVAEQNRAKAPGRDAINASCRAMLRVIARQIARIDADIDALVKRCQVLARSIAVLQELPGVGPRTAIGLAAFMPELGSMTRRQAAALAGVAPHPKDSGTIRGHRSLRGGRPHVRTILFMAALAASRAKGHLSAFFQRLVDNGKKPIVAIAALMRKIIVTLNARLRDDRCKQS